ncbi:calcium-binding protein [bacterium]|nr:calcium-binding protein [bacterium]
MSIKDGENRVRRILNISENEKLPTVSKETLAIYYRYLISNLSFPFEVVYSVETGPLEDTYYRIKVTGFIALAKSPLPETYGIFIRGKQERRRFEVPLAETKVKEHGRNKQLVDDYCMWFWNHQ